MYQEITSKQLTELIQSGADIEVIDVREKSEWDTIRIPQAKLIPLGSLPFRFSEIDFSKAVYVFCRSGARSGQACRWLLSE